MVISLFLLQSFLILATGATFQAALGPESAMEFVLGASISALNATAMALAWRLIFVKKVIALAGSVIVIKYAFLALSLHFVLTQAQVDSLSFVTGVGFVLPMVTLWAIIRNAQWLQPISIGFSSYRE